MTFKSIFLHLLSPVLLPLPPLPFVPLLSSLLSPLPLPPSLLCLDPSLLCGVSGESITWVGGLRDPLFVLLLELFDGCHDLNVFSRHGRKKSFCWAGRGNQVREPSHDSCEPSRNFANSSFLMGKNDQTNVLKKIPLKVEWQKSKKKN